MNLNSKFVSRCAGATFGVALAMCAGVETAGDALRLATDSVQVTLLGRNTHVTNADSRFHTVAARGAAQASQEFNRAAVQSVATDGMQPMSTRAEVESARTVKTAAAVDAGSTFGRASVR